MGIEKYENTVDVPSIALGKEFDLINVLRDSTGLKIRIKPLGSTGELTILFEDVYSFRSSTESCRLRVYKNFEEFLPGVISRVNNSEYLKWFHEESNGIYDPDDASHYFIMTVDEFIDVISPSKPMLIDQGLGQSS